MRTKATIHRIESGKSDLRSIGHPRIQANALHRGSHLPCTDLSTGEKRKLSMICGLSLIFAILSVARAAHSAAAPAHSAPAPVPGSVEHQFVKSTFVSAPGSIGFGKDPFFPKTARFAMVPRTTPTEVGPAPISALVLKGISGPKNHRLAIINNRTFEAGEEADIKVMGQSFHVKCVEVREDGAVVSINGQIQKLSLGPKQL